MVQAEQILPKLSAISVFFAKPACLLHRKEISISVFPEKELRGLSPIFHIYVSVSDLYIPTIGPPIFS
jgi:hypothetical protein